MNLLQLANFVCAKVRHTDALSVAACKTFLNRRYQMIYDSEVWRDSLFLSTPILVPATSPQDAMGIYILPLMVDRVVAVRTTSGQLQPANLEEYFRIDTDIYEQTGTPAQFSILSPMAWDLGSISATFYDLAYVGAPGAQIAGGYQNAADLNKIITIVYQDTEGAIGTLEIPITADYLVTGVLSWYTISVAKIISAKKDVTIGAVALLTKQAGGGTLGFAMGINDTEMPQYSRLKLTYAPTVSTQLRILFKMKWAEMADTDSPTLRGIENTLIAFAQSDMLQRERQYAKANLLAAEGINLLAKYTEKEVYQQAFDQRFTPDAEPLMDVDSGTAWLRGP